MDGHLDTARVTTPLRTAAPYAVAVAAALVLGGVLFIAYPPGPRATAPQPTTALAGITVAPTTPDASLPAHLAGLSACVDALRDGATIDKSLLDRGCHHAGERLMVMRHACSDGRWLVTVGPGVPGIPNGWGWLGDKIHATPDPSTDPGWRSAYESCTGLDIDVAV